MHTPQDDLIFEERKGRAGDVGIITLNRPRVLNCLTNQMVRALYQQLQHWQQAPSIKAVVIQAVPGKAFCAGGDIRSTYELMRAKETDRLMQFFRDEFKLNRALFHFPKPYIAFLDGVTMGGGVGISLYGSHRVATDNLVFAMPETAIGFFPDIGANYFLPRLPGKIGWYLGLTGKHITVSDAVALQLAQHQVPSLALETLLDRIIHTDLGATPHATVTALIEAVAQNAMPSSLLAAQESLDACFSHATMEAIQASLIASAHPLCQEAAKMLAKRSPTSLKVTLRALNEGQQLDFDQCIQQAFTLANHFAIEHDFCEGVRAVIIDKDHQPAWQPATLEAVTEENVAQYFAPNPHLLALY